MDRWTPRLRRLPGFLLFALVFCAWLAAPGAVADTAREGLGRCASVVVPTLFPFFVLSNLFVRRSYYRVVEGALRPLMGPLFGLSGGAAGAVALGAVGGYPIGAATVFRLYDCGRLDRQQAARALAFCNNAGPGFILGVAGLGLLGSVRLGVLLYAVHLLSAAAVGVLFRRLLGPLPPVCRRTPGSGPAALQEPFAESLVSSVRDAAGTIVQVCAFLVFFSVLLHFFEALPLWNLLPDLLRPLAVGAVELSTGVARLGGAAASQSQLIACCAFLLGWGGLCVHCQTLSLRGARPILMAYHTVGKLLQGLLSAALAQLLTTRSPVLLLTLAVLILPFALAGRRTFDRRRGRSA